MSALPVIADGACRYPACARPGVGVRLLCEEHVCERHVAKHFLVRRYAEPAR